MSRLARKLAVTVVWVTACSPATEPGVQLPDAAVDLPDAGATPMDAGFDAGVFAPAPHAPLIQVTPSGGPVLSAPHLAIATFDADPLASQVEAFAASLGASDYWHQVTGEYGVGPVTFDRGVHLTGAPATTTMPQIATWLTAQLDGTHPEWGPVDANVVYTIVYPTSTRVTDSGASICSSSPAYHEELTLGSGTHVAYVVIARCDPFMSLTGIDYLTAGLSHEWIEAVTDPLYDSNPAWQGPPAANTVWTFATGGELADLCTPIPGAYVVPEGLPYRVQRSWSNASAGQSHDPCVPRPAEPYFGAAVAEPDALMPKIFGYPLALQGVKLAVGETKSLDVTLFSDAPLDTPWSVEAVDLARLTGGTHALELTWDQQTGVNGQTLHLQIKRDADTANLKGAAFFELISTLGSRKSVWYGTVGD